MLPCSGLDCQYHNERCQYWKTIICLPHYQITKETRSLMRCCLPVREQISVVTSCKYQILKCSMTQMITFQVSRPSQWSTLLKAAAEGRELKRHWTTESHVNSAELYCSPIHICSGSLIRATLNQTTSTSLLNYLKYKTGRAALSVSGNPHYY